MVKKIKTLEQLEKETKKLKINPRLALVAADDESAIKSVIEAAKGNIVDPVLIGNGKNIKRLCKDNYIDVSRIEIIEVPDQAESIYHAVELFKKGKIDMIMKGLVSTSTLLRVILDKERGMPPEGILSHVRHPMYLGVLLIYLGFIFLSISLVSVLVWIIIIIIYDRLATFEEKELERLFAEQFLEYKNKVPKWIIR